MSWGESLVTAPAERVVSLEEVKRYLRVDDNESDIDLLRLIGAATERCQNLTRRQLITATRKLRLPCFPYGREIYLPWSPIQATLPGEETTHVKYRDTLDVLQTFSASNYRVSTDSEPGFIQLDDTKTWPTTELRFGAVEITYVCGYGATYESVPELLRHAVLMMVGHMYEYRADVSKMQLHTLPNGIASILDQYRVGDEFIRYDNP